MLLLLSFSYVLKFHILACFFILEDGLVACGILKVLALFSFISSCACSLSFIDFFFNFLTHYWLMLPPVGKETHEKVWPPSWNIKG